MSIRALFRQHVSKFVAVRPFVDPRDSKAKQEEADREIERVGTEYAGGDVVTQRGERRLRTRSSRDDHLGAPRGERLGRFVSEGTGARPRDDDPATEEIDRLGVRDPTGPST